MGCSHVTFLLWQPSLGPRPPAARSEPATALSQRVLFYEWKMSSQPKIAHLTADEKQRYFNKIDILGCDPYLLPNQLLTPLKSAENLPKLSFGDIYIYLVHNPSPYTGDHLKAFKSTDAYRFFTSGWVTEAKVCHLETKKIILIIGRVDSRRKLRLYIF